MPEPEPDKEPPAAEEVETAGIQITERDILFECPHCGGELIVDRDGAGLTLPCALCHGSVVVPEYLGPSLQFLQAATVKLTQAIQTARNSSPRKYHFDGRS